MRLDAAGRLLVNLPNSKNSSEMIGVQHATHSSEKRLPKAAGRRRDGAASGRAAGPKLPATYSTRLRLKVSGTGLLARMSRKAVCKTTPTGPRQSMLRLQRVVREMAWQSSSSERRTRQPATTEGLMSYKKKRPLQDPEASLQRP